MNHIPDPLLKTVKIPVVFKDGIFKLLDGSRYYERYK